MTTRIAGSKYVSTDSTTTGSSDFQLYVEHSVAKSAGSITGHGVIYTMQETSVDSLVLNSDNPYVNVKAAKLSQNALTGMLEISVKVSTSNGPGTVWVRPYIVDKDGNVIYGNTSEVKLTDPTRPSGQGSDGELITLGTEVYDLTALSSDGEAEVTFDEPTEKSPFDYIVALFAKLVEMLKTLISFIMNSGARI